MMAAQPESPAAKGTRSLEVRWIFPGQLPAPAGEWFGRFPAETTAVQDAYLLDPHLPGLSVKVRGRRALEVKVYGGSPGQLKVAGRARGRLESWQKWSFPHGPPSHGSGSPAGWRPVNKSRRITWFSLAGRQAQARVLEMSQEPGCAVELTEIHAGSETWWTLGFEATGPASTLRSELEAAAAHVFAEAPPKGMALDMDYSMSYAQWLRWRPDAGKDAET